MLGVKLGYALLMPEGSPTLNTKHGASFGLEAGYFLFSYLGFGVEFDYGIFSGYQPTTLSGQVMIRTIPMKDFFITISPMLGMNVGGDASGIDDPILVFGAKLTFERVYYFDVVVGTEAMYQYISGDGSLQVVYINLVAKYLF